MADSTPADRPEQSEQPDRPVYVIGGGPAGLSVAYALRARGIRAVVLEKSEHVGASWRRHYDRLHLHTTRRLSALPGLPMPRRFGRWVAATTWCATWRSTRSSTSWRPSPASRSRASSAPPTAPAGCCTPPAAAS